MKLRVTKDEILEEYSTVLSVGYCWLQFLFHFEEPFAYVCSEEGWDADIYEFDGVAVCTGYRPFGKEVPHDLTQPFNEIARWLINSSDKSDDKLKERFDALIEQFISDAKSLD